MWQKVNGSKRRKIFRHCEISGDQHPTPTRKAMDYRETGVVGRRSFLRKMGIAGASLAPVLALLVASLAMADDTFVKFKGGIGVIPVSSVGPTGAPLGNVVRGIQPPGQPWVIRALTAEVKVDGRIH